MPQQLQCKPVIYNTITDERPDIYALHKVQNAGFRTFIAKDSIPDGRYRIGIIHRAPQEEHLIYTNDYLTKSNSTFFDRFVAERTNVLLPSSNNGFKFQVEVLEQVAVKGSDFIHLQGYALAPVKESTKAFFVFNDGKEHITFDAISIKRPDVVDAYQNPNYVNSGFETYIYQNPKLKGNFRIGLLLLDSGSTLYSENTNLYALQ